MEKFVLKPASSSSGTPKLGLDLRGACEVPTINTTFGTFQLFIEDTESINLSGAGTQLDPLRADLILSPASNNAAILDGQGLFVYNTIQNGRLYGGLITWFTDFDYHISEAGYYINGQFYRAPSTFGSLSTPDDTHNRLDTFVLTTSETAIVLEGTPSENPAQATIDPETQLLLSLVLVETGTTTPDIGRECLYQENDEFTFFASNVGQITPASSSAPCSGTISIQGTNVTNGNYFSLTRDTAFTPGNTYTQLSFYLKATSSWAGTRKIRVQWYSGATPVGSIIEVANGTFGFNGLDTSSCQVIAIPMASFVLGSASVDSVRFTAVTSANVSYMIDSICLQDGDVEPLPQNTDEKIKISSTDLSAGYLINKLLEGSGISLTRNNPGANETYTIASTVNVSANNGITENTPDNFQLGGSLIQATTINTTASYYLAVTGSILDSVNQGVLRVINTNNSGQPSTALVVSGTYNGAVVDGGVYGVYASATGSTGTGIRANSGSGAAAVGVYGFSAQGYPLQGHKASTTNSNGVLPTLNLIRTFSSGSVSDGIGQSIRLGITTTSSSVETSHNLVSKWTTANDATRISQFEIEGVNAGTLARKLALAGTGGLTLDAYGSGTFTGTATKIAGFTSAGLIIEVDPSSFGASTTADNGLIMSIDTNVQFGGPISDPATLLHDTYINGGTYSINLTSAATDPGSTLIVSNTGAGGDAITASSTNYIAVRATSTNATAFIATNSAQASYTARIVAIGTDPTQLTKGLEIVNAVADPTGLNNPGIDLLFTLNTHSFNYRAANRFVSKWTNSADLARTSQLVISGVDNTVEDDILTLNGDGSIQANAYGAGSITGTPEYLIGTDASGNLIEVALSGGGGGDSLFPVTGTGVATGSVTGDLDENVLVIESNSNYFFGIDPSTGAENVIFRSVTELESGFNSAGLEANSTITDVQASFFAEFEDGVEVAKITAEVTSSGSYLNYNADQHEVDGNVKLNALSGNGSGIVAVDDDGNLSWSAGGGSGSGTVNSGTQYRIAYYASTGTAVSEASAITANRVLISDANGVPTHAITTATEIGYVSGVTSAIQSQLDGKISGSLTSGRVPFATGGTALSDHSSFTWDNTNHKLLIGDGTSTTGILTVNGGNQSGVAGQIIIQNAGTSQGSIAGGNLGFTFSGVNNRNVNVTSLGTGNLTLSSQGSTGITYNASNAAGSHIFQANGATRATIDSTGLLLSGSTSGAATIAAPAIAGTPVLTLPIVTGILVQYVHNTTASSATPTPTGNAKENIYTITALAADAVFAAPSGTATDGNIILIRIKDNGTIRTLGFNAIYRAGDIPLPTATVVGETIYLQFIYNSADSKWDLIGLTTGF